MCILINRFYSGIMALVSGHVELYLEQCADLPYYYHSLLWVSGDCAAAIWLIDTKSDRIILNNKYLPDAYICILSSVKVQMGKMLNWYYIAK